MRETLPDVPGMVCGGLRRCTFIICGCILSGIAVLRVMRVTDLKDGIMSLTPSSFTVCSLLGMVLMSGCAVRQAPDAPTRAPLVRAEFTGSSAPLDVQLEGYVMAQEALAADSLGDREGRTRVAHDIG